MFKKMFVLMALVAGLTATSVNAAVVYSNVGDSDCFGLGGTCADGDAWRDDLGGVFFTDYRDATDLATAAFTDIWDSPADVNWVHTYDLDGESVVSAVLNLFIAGFADIGAVDFYADNTLIANFDFPGEFDIVQDLAVSVPVALIDGSTSFTLGTSGGDGFIIDMASLVIETEATDDGEVSETVPQPASFALLLLGLAGISLSRRNRG